MIFDYCVVGGGIVGMATARALVQRRPGASVVVLEKERELARHQTGHNSGVIHAGIYYAPGSLKAELCRRGEARTKEFCAEHAIPFQVPGKLLVATDEGELARMDALHERSRVNGVEVERLSAAELAEREPQVRGLGALLVKTTGIVDFAQVCDAMGRVVRAAGGVIEFGAAVTAIRESADEVAVVAGDRRFRARHLVVCGGVQADRLAAMSGLAPDFRIVPFRGEYYRLPSSRKGIVRHLIYPIPDPALPFLGVHLTTTIDGGVTVGPNAVLGLAREGYRKLSFNARDVRDVLTYPGFWKVARENVRTGAVEMRNSLWKRGYLNACRRYCPDLRLNDLLPEEAGIRAQAVLRDGTMVHDFLFHQTDRTLHVCNAPSPAATSAIPIAELIVDRIFHSG
jgi:L-2-hydroxyglutarate oxidase